jgi:hypothetical protein
MTTTPASAAIIPACGQGHKTYRLRRGRSLMIKLGRNKATPNSNCFIPNIRHPGESRDPSLHKRGCR